MELLTAGGKTYLKAETAYWTTKGSAAIATVAAGKCSVVPATWPAAMSDSTAGNLLSQIHPSAAGQLSTTLVKTEVNGVPAYHLTTKAIDPKPYVLTDGQARLLRGPGFQRPAECVGLHAMELRALASAPAAAQVATISTR
jgi:hypothetical protein